MFKHGLQNIPKAVWALGLVSLLMDISSEMIHGLLPAFMIGVLGASGAAVGLIEGIADATSSITKVFSGLASDRIRKRKSLVLLGYSLSAFTKPLFALAPSLGWVLSARFADRVGKGVRGAPRDALIADIAPPETRGACFGLRQSLDNVGAVVGPLLAIGLMAVSSDNFRFVFALAIIPGLLAVYVLAKGVKEPETPRAPADGSLVPQWSRLGTMGSAYWRILILTALVNLARFSEAFLVLKTQEQGLPLAWLPAVLIVLNLVYAAAAYPAGRYSDRLGSRTLLLASLVTLILCDLIMAIPAGPLSAFIGIGFWGLHLAFSQGILARLIADTAPRDLRGTGFGLFHLVSGLCLLLSSALAGILWDVGPSVPFWAGATLALAALAGTLKLGLK